LFWSIPRTVLNAKVYVVEGNGKVSLNGKLEQYKKNCDALPDPSEGRIQELKAAIRAGTLITPQSIRGAANRLYELFSKGKLPN